MDAKRRAESIKRSKLKKPEKYKALREAWIKNNKAAYDAAIAAAKKRKPEKYKALRKAWEEKNRIELREKRKEWEDKNRDRIRAKRRVWEDKNRESINARHRKWSAENKEKILINTRIQQARRRSAVGKFTKEDIEKIFNAQKGKCAYYKVCGTKLTSKGGYHIDHILAVSRGGTSDPSNIQILCPRCNKMKGAKDASTFMQMHGLLL